VKQLSLVLILATACASAPPRIHAAPTAGGSSLIAVSAGNYSSGGGIVDATYVVDPAARLCFFTGHVVSGDVAPAGLTEVDCCHLLHIPQIRAALPSLDQGECAAVVPPVPDAAPAEPPPVAPPPAAPAP
jgi:hypothetical protein